MMSSRNREAATVFVYTILFLFFFQLITDYIAGIYGYGVLGTGIPAELGAVVLFFSPFLLLLFGRGVPTTALIVLAELVLLSRAVEVFLPTRTQLLVAGLGTSLFLFLFPALLWQWGQKRDRSAGPLMVAGLVLAISLSIMLRSLGSTIDLSNEGWFRAIAWLLGIAAAVLVPRVFRSEPVPDPGNGEGSQETAGWGKSIGLGLGIASVFLLLYFAFTSPAVISRWVRVDYLFVLGLVVLALVLLAWLLTYGKERLASFSRNRVLILTAVFTVALTLILGVNHVAFPDQPSAYPLAEPEVSAVWIIALLAMVLLFPVLFLAFGLLVEEVIISRPTMRKLGLGFGLASLYMLLMILANVFTSVWSYIDPILEPVSRNRFWLVHGIVGLVLTLSLLAVSKKAAERSAQAAGGAIGGGFAEVVTTIGVIALVAGLLLSPDPAEADPAGRLKVAAYNLQQDYDIFGQRAHAAQCDVLKEIDADIIALSETDTARIAGGNFDLVRYLAECLNMYSEYGPRTQAGTFGYALLSKYPIENAETLHLFSGPNLPSSDDPEGSNGGDQVAVIKAEVTYGDQTYTIFVNHFDGNPPIEQPQGLVELVEGVDKAIVMGDFNCHTGRLCFETITEVLDECGATIGDPNAADDHVDHIFVSPGLTCPGFTYIRRDASDHPALAAEIEP